MTRKPESRRVRLDSDIAEPPPKWKRKLRRHLPITRWLPQYTKTDLIQDTIAGLTLGLTMIPQSIAYASLAGLGPQFGLYSAFMGSIIYVFFGTIKEVSIGPTSIMSLLTLEFTKDLSHEFVFLLTFLVGCVELLLGVLKLGFLVDFISAPVTTGFQSAASCLIVASQLKGLLGLRKYKSSNFIDTLTKVYHKLPETRLGDTALGLSLCIFLLLFRKLKDLPIGKEGKPLSRVQSVIKKFLWFLSLSRNAIAVVVASAIAYKFEAEGESPFLLSGTIKPGLPPLSFPPFTIQHENSTYNFFEICSELGSSIILIPFVGILMNVAIAKAFASGASIDATQEMLTLGICNISGSFVSSLPTCGAFTRSAVSNASGVRTPLAGLYTGSIILLALTFLTPYFYIIPRASLSAVLISAVIFMIDWQTGLVLWKSNKRDFFCAVLTFLSCLMFGVERGLIVGVIINIGQLLYLWARPSISIQIKNTDEGNYYLVTPDIGLFFPAIEFLRNEINKHCLKQIPIVIDCLHFKGVDYTTAQGINAMVKDMRQYKKKVFFINMNSRINKILTKTNVTFSECPSQIEISSVLFQRNSIMTLPDMRTQNVNDREQVQLIK